MIISTTGGVSSQGSLVQTGPGQLDRDAFLKLLIVQLRNQDPLKPMEDKEFIAELAQFSSLEQMQLTNRSLETFIQNVDLFAKSQSAFAAAGLIGRTITAIDPSPPVDEETGESSERVLTAKVESVRFKGGESLLRIRVTEKDRDTGEYVEVEKDIPLQNVLSVS